MKDIILKRNELKRKSIKLRTIKFSPELKNKQTDKIIEEQNKVYDKYNFYDKFLKARDEVKDEK